MSNIKYSSRNAHCVLNKDGSRERYYVEKIYINLQNYIFIVSIVLIYVSLY